MNVYKVVLVDDMKQPIIGLDGKPIIRVMDEEQYNGLSGIVNII